MEMTFRLGRAEAALAQAIDWLRLTLVVIGAMAVLVALVHGGSGSAGLGARDGGV